TRQATTPTEPPLLSPTSENPSITSGKTTASEDGNTLSERVRAWFRVHTRPGRAVFAVAWTGFATWFLVHILT
ncbi:hypothetical protein ABZ202_29455, partial [Streptomyces sp. NPDC006186]